MKVMSAVLERLVSALLMAVGVALLTAGLLSWAPQPQTGTGTPSAEPTEVAGNPILDTPTAGATPVVTATPQPTPLASPVPSSPAAASQTPSLSPSPSAQPSPTAVAAGAPASRIVIPSLNVDLPVMAGDAQVRGNRDNYPLCDVAQYLTYFVNPGDVGTVYIYAHAQRGMFLPLLRASLRNDGAEMLGALVEVYTADNRLHLYEIFRVKRHARDYDLATNVEPGEHRLVLQTSEGRSGHVPKLQLAARPIAVVPADPAEANPEPDPRVCLPPR